MDNASGAVEHQEQTRANELYWHSDRSVNRIAEELDLSKGTLYGLIRPLEAGIECPECSTSMEYPNRTARDRGFLVCPGCGLEEEAELILREAEASLDDGDDFDRQLGAPRSGLGTRGTRIVVGTALLGVAAGIVLTVWMRRR